MKPVVTLTEQEYQAYARMYAELCESIRDLFIKDMFEGFAKRPGYAHYAFEGKITDKLIGRLGRMPTEEEVIMIVDGGFSHFGATCRITPDGYFSGRVNID